MADSRKEAERAYKRRYAAKKYAADPVAARAKQTEWRKANPERYREIQRLARERRKEKSRRYERERSETDIQYRVARLLRSRFSKAVRRGGKSGSAVDELGCSVSFLISHLESQFSEGMSWDNYGDWHIDHIIPLASFDLTDPSEVSKSCHYTNLQPLWAKENQSKGSKMPDQI